MAVEVQPGRQVKHNGILYKAGELIHSLEDEAKKELVLCGAVKDLENVDQQVKQDAHTIAGQAEQDADELRRDNVGPQINSQAAADVKAAIDTLNAPGTQVTQGGQEVKQPSDDEVAATAAGVQ